MTKIKYIENKKDEKFNIGDFVKVPADICDIDRIELGIITGWQGGTYCNVKPVGHCFYYLKQKNGYFVLVTLHSDNELYSWDGDETNILYCPICGRRLDENRNN